MTSQQPPSPNLPDEIWLSIFTHTITNSDHHLDSLSLVSKRFLTLTNLLKHTLRLLPSYPNPNTTLPTLLIHRFTNLRSIDASRFPSDLLHSLLHLISHSHSPIQALDISGHFRLPVHGLVRLGKRIRVLKCSRIWSLRNDDLVAVADAMPSVTDLDISYPRNDRDSMRMARRNGRADLNDNGVVEMSARLPDWTTINVSGNPFITDRAIVALAMNCGKLREIVAVGCCFVTQSGIAEAIGKCPNLASVSVDGMDWGYSESAKIIGSSRSLSALHFSCLWISDEFLCCLTEARLPLKEITVSSCYGFSLVGVSSLVSAYRSLTYLNFKQMWCLMDEAMSGLVEFVPRLVSINLNRCSKVGHLTLFAIVKFCCCIEQVSMKHTSLGRGWVPTGGDVSMVNRSIRALKVAGNLLPDECAVRIALACPNLEVVDLSQCRGITAIGISGILNSCREIRHLCLNQLSIDELMKWQHGCKIEVLEMKDLLGMNDGLLDMLASRCPNMLSVDLSGCVHLSVDALKRFVGNCTKLRQIRLDWCEEMSFRNLASMVFRRRSLRKVVFDSAMSGTLMLTAEQKDVLLQHGCQIHGAEQHFATSYCPRMYSNYV